MTRRGQTRNGASSWSSTDLDRKYSRSRSPAALEIAVRAGGIAQRVGLIDGDLYRPALHDIEQFAGGGQQVLPRCRVRIQGRPGEEKRALGSEDAHVDRPDRARRLAERNQQPERRETVERFVECV